MKKRRILAGTIGALVLGGVLVASVGSGIAPAEAQTPTTSAIIIAKLNEILALLTGAASQANHTLRWDTNNLPASRFTKAFTGAVLDKNTGLVWEQATSGTATYSWYNANSYCLNKNVGGTAGWRLPSVVELKSVQDGSPTAVAPLVPATVFSGVQSANYWSASTGAENIAGAWVVDFSNGFVGLDNKSYDAYHAWCVRGPMSESAL
jgi:hypothetical protein